MKHLATSPESCEGERPLPAAGSASRISRKLVWSAAACGSSTVAHLVLLLALGLAMVSLPVREKPIINITSEPERLREELTARLPTQIQPAPPGPTLSSGVVISRYDNVPGTNRSTVHHPKSDSKIVDRQTSVRVDVGVGDPLNQSGTIFRSELPAGANGDPISPVSGYAEAMDRMTQEILNMLARRKVLIVWALDQSESMEDDRLEITTRIQNVYDQLGLSGAVKGDALLTAVTSYGATTANHTPQPTSQVDEIMAAIRSVPNDPSGKEMQCQAAAFAMASFQRVAAASDRQLAVIMVTDESGDMNTNLSQLEQTIELAKTLNCKIFVLGRESVFGYPYAYMRYHHEETKTNHWLRIDRGPETPWPEQLQIDGFHARNDAFPSGFGPYEQSRMARETGGVFFMLPSPEVNLVGRRADLIYDADGMRPYLPSLATREAYTYERDRSPMRAVVWKVIVDLNPYDKTHGSRIGVQTAHFSIDPTKFAAQAQTQLARAQDMIVYLQAAQQAMEAVAPLKNRETSPRWRANYELIYAQTLAYEARLQEYGWYLAEFVKTPKPIVNSLGPARPTNEWNVHVVRRLLKPEITQSLRDRADELFREIVKNHAGTPWAARAEFELRRGYGIELVEGYEDPRNLAGRGITLPKP